MSDEAIEKTATRDRSPSFPFISLKAAIARLEEFEQKFGRQDAPADRVYLAWGYKGDTSQAQQTLAALKSFGLVNYKGTGPKRLVAISDDARTYLRAQQESLRKGLLKRFALTPKWIANFWPIWGDHRGPDEICLDTLVLTHKFNDNSAPKFLSIYDDTIAYARLSESDKSEPERGITHDPEDELKDAVVQPPPEHVRHVALASPPIAPSPPIGKPRIVMNGDHLDIHASVDLEGLKKLQTMLKKYEEILEMMAPSKGEAAN
jgi:hypothetical protein